MLNGINIGDMIWYQGSKFEIVDIKQPNKYDDFILAKADSGMSHPDGSSADDIILIDAHNDEFYPDCSEVREIMAADCGLTVAELLCIKGYIPVAVPKNLSKADSTLKNYWLNTVLDECDI